MLAQMEVSSMVPELLDSFTDWSIQSLFIVLEKVLSPAVWCPSRRLARNYAAFAPASHFSSILQE